MTGARLASPQNLACPICGGEIFVFPHGPWLELAGSTPRAGPPPPPRTLTIRDYLLPVAASALALAFVVLAYRLWMVPLLFPKRPERSDQPADVQKALAERLARGRKLLAEGNFRLALEEMKSDEGSADLGSLTREERRAWQQVGRQAALLCDLLPEPLEDIIRHGAGVRDQEWQAEFRHRFLGKSLVLDTEFRGLGGGRWEVLYPLFHGQDRARISVDDLKILEAVPGQNFQRLVVGARLASIKLELPGPAWVVRFEPDSGVFLTEPAAAARVCPALADPEAISVLERQHRWVR